MAKKKLEEYGFEPEVMENGTASNAATLEDYGFEPEEPLKKKDLASPDGSDSVTQSEQPSTPSEQPTGSAQPTHDLSKINLERPKSPEQIRQEAGTKEQLQQFQDRNVPEKNVDPITALVQTVKSGIADQLPKEYYTQRLRMSKGSFGDLFDPRSNLNQFSDKLPKEISRDEFNIWNNKQPDKIRTQTYDKKAEIFLKEKIGDEGYQNLMKQFSTENLQERLGFEKEIQQQNVEASERLKGVVQDLRDVNSAGDFLNFAGNMVGQTLYRAPTSLLTGTVGSVVAESSAVYDRQLDLIAEKNGISREEVIKQGLDEPAAGQAVAVLAGTLDAVSSVNLVGMFKKAAGKQLTESMAKQFVKGFVKGGAPEAITEGAQGELEELGATQGAGVEYTADPWRIATSTVGGLIGGGPVGGITNISTAKTIEQSVQTLDPNDTESIKDAAVNVQQKIESDAEPISTTPEGDEPTTPKADNDIPRTGVQEPVGQSDEGGVQQEPEATPTQEELKQQILNSPEDLSWNGNKVTILTEKGADMLRQYQQLKEKNLSSPNELSNTSTQEESRGSNEKNQGVEEISTRLQSHFKNASAKLEGLTPTDQLDLEKKETVKFAKDNNLWINDVYELGEPGVSGQENTLAYDAENSVVYKSNNLANSKNSVSKLLDQVKAHNELFPETKYDVVGFTGTDSEGERTPHVEVVLKQDLVNDAEQATPQEIATYMESIGFTKVNDTTFKNDQYEVSDLHPRNVLKDSDGTIYVVDNIISKVPSNEGKAKPNQPGQTTPQGSTQGVSEVKQETGQTMLGARIEASEEPMQIKEQVKGRDQYIPRKIIKTNEEASQILDQWNDNEFAERAIRDTSNEMPGGTRGTLAANLYERYKQAADAAQSTDERSSFYNKAADIAVWAAQHLTKQGQETAIAGKIWKSITSNEDLLVLAMEKGQQRAASDLITPIREKVKTAKEDIERQIREQVTVGVEQQLQRAKLITKEQKKSISDAFDKLKIQKPEGTLGATTLLPEVWNGAVEAIKRAVLTGADLANAIQAGVDYVRANHKGDFNEDDFKKQIQPAVEQLIPKQKVAPSSINPKQVNTPKLKGKKKANFISEVVEEINETGSISDERFEELYAKQLGAKEFSAEERTKIRELAKIIAETEQFKEEVKKKFTRENIKKYEGLLKRAQDANDELQKFAQTKKNTVWDTLSTILQGNLLAPISIMRNIYSNLVYQPLRFMSTATGSIVDRGLTELAKTGLLGKSFSDIVGKERTISLTGLNRGYLKGGWNGLMEGLLQMKTGQRVEEANLRDINPQFDPLKAIKRWAEKDRTLPQKINDAVEGTFGLPAEGMFRLLNLGDKPFRRAAELARAFEIAKLKGLKNEEVLKFVMFPDDESAQEIDLAGKKATFQDESAAAKMIQTGIFNILNNLPGPLKVLAKSQIPYVRTPVNILAETLDYAIPPLTLMRGISAISKGNKRSGSVLIGKAMVGFMIQQTATLLLNAGLMTWSDDEDDSKATERRSLQYDNENPNSLNVSALSRGLSGQGFTPKDEDVWVDYKNLGVIGIVLQNRANRWYEDKKSGEVESDSITGMLADVGMDGVRTLSSAFDQSFLQGTNTLIKALEDPEGYQGQKWLLNTAEALTSIAIPRTITSISSASDDYIRDTRDKDTKQALENIFKKNLFQGDKLAAKVNLWGEKITGNPEGRERIPYYLFDVTRFKEVDRDSFKFRLYEKWKADNFNDDWIPSMPQRSVSIKGVRIPLTNQEYEQFSTEVGQARAKKLGAYMSRKDQDKLKVDDVKEKYSAGYNQGRTRFTMNTGWNMWSKSKLEQLAKDREKK